jgi:diguanylate cyclase (GGDEF)-like protein
MAKEAAKAAKRPGKPRARRLWSLPASRRAHGAADDIAGIERTLNHASWLLLALVALYALFVRRDLSSNDVALVWGGAFAYAAVLLGAHLFGPPEQAPSTWPMLARCWAMIAYITCALWALRIDTGTLVTLYHLAVIASAVSLSARLTALNLAIIGGCLILLAHPSHSDNPQAMVPALTLFEQLAPMLLVAYITSSVAGDIRNALERIRFISETDELTRLFNLRAFMRVAERIHRQARRYDRPYALLMVDSDNLKAVNDTHGHQCGNELLKLTTACIRRELRETDVAGRYGGDEFILLLPETTVTGGRELAERIRRSVETRTLDGRGRQVRTTVSIGVASFPAHGADLHSILNKADQAMYLAKKAGRNRVVPFDPPDLT